MSLKRHPLGDKTMISRKKHIDRVFDPDQPSAIPFNKPFVVGKELSYIARAVSEWKHRRGWGVYQVLQSVPRGSVQDFQGPVDSLMHGGAGDRGNSLRTRTGRRSDHAIVHVRLHGQCRSEAGRSTSLRGHSPGHPEHR